jgi:hypothetical protein
MNIYDFVSLVFAVCGVALIYFKKTNLLGGLCIAMYFALQGMSLLSDNQNPILLFLLSALAAAFIIYRYFHSEQKNKYDK